MRQEWWLEWWGRGKYGRICEVSEEEMMMGLSGEGGLC